MDIDEPRQMMIRSFLLAGVFSSAVLLACSGGSGSTGGAGGSDTFVAQYCDLFGPCCGKVQKTYDQAKCTAVLTALGGGRPYDATKADQCLASARADSASPTFCDEGISDATDDLCEKVYNTPAGTKKPGDTCEDSAECAPSTEGDVSCTTFFDNNASTRICRLQVRAKENEDCTGTKDGDSTFSTGTSGGATPRALICYMEDGLYCHGTTKKCARLQGPGGTCDSSSSCDKTSYCDFGPRQCVARKAAGADCAGTSTMQCIEKHYCDETTKKCIPQLAGGSACTKSAQCANGSCTNGKCSSDSFTTSLVCN